MLEDKGFLSTCLKFLKFLNIDIEFIFYFWYYILEGKWAARMPTFLFIMIEIRDDLKKKIKEVVESNGFELFSIDWKGSERRGLLIVKIDSIAGINVKDCEEVSKALSILLDMEEPFSFPYSLEVSSPGIERPIRNLNEFLRYTGKPVNIFSKGENYKGVIFDVVDDTIYLKIKNQIKSFIFSDIEKANLLGPWEEL